MSQDSEETKTAGILIDEYKLPVFESGLKEAGYTYIVPPCSVRSVVVLKVTCTDLLRLEELTKKLNLEATKLKLH